MPKKKIVPLRKLVKKLDQVFSEWSRYQKADWRGNVTCYTCGHVIPWKEAQNSHFISRIYYSTRWEPKNTAPACVACNIFKHGNLDEFALHLVRDYGPSILEELNKQKYSQIHFTRQDYLSMIADYEARLKELRNKKGNTTSGAKDRPRGNRWEM